MWWLKSDEEEGKGNVQRGTRPVIILSNNDANKHSPVILVAPCTTQTKTNLPTHVTFMYKSIENTILIEQSGPVNTESLLGYCCTLDEELIEKVDKALGIAYGIRSEHSKRNSTGSWSTENKQKLIKMMAEGNLMGASSEFGLTPNTVKSYYTKFLKEAKNENYHKLIRDKTRKIYETQQKLMGKEGDINVK
jgi:mRNA interferase MazF